MPALRDWWRMVTTALPDNPSDDLRNAEERAEDQAERIAVLELKVRAIEARIRAQDAAARHRKPA